jgi:hypothetical protein
MAARKHIDWDAQPLGVVADGAIARRLLCTPEAVALARRKRGINPVNRAATRLPNYSAAKPFVGKHTDADVARLAGITFKQARNARLFYGASTTRIDWSKQPLGFAPDIVLARKHGVCNKVVAQARWRLGIPRWHEERLCPCGGAFVAFHLQQKYCSYRCQRYHWQLCTKNGLAPESADIAIALWAFKKTAKEKRNGLANITRTA